MEFIYNNGDVNVGLITIISIVSILIILVLISIFSKSAKKEEEELEDYYDKVNKGKGKAKVKSKVNIKKVKNVGKEKPHTKKTTKSITSVKPKIDLKTTKLEESIKAKKINKTDVQQVDEVEEVVTEVKNKKEPVVRDSTQPTSTTLTSTKHPVKDKQTDIKVIKLGNIQVKESIHLNEAEKIMLSGVLTSSDRGHIIQLINGSKIMDFPIDSLTQLNHIERQIGRFGGSGNSNYVVYVVWESNLKHRVHLSQKLRYNPNVRYK